MSPGTSPDGLKALRPFPVLRLEERQRLERHYFEGFVYPEPNSGCWLWAGATYSDGYGQLGFHGQRYAAHRAFYFFKHGRAPTQEGCHRCDVRCCVNPDHLFDGSHLENMTDCAVKGRAGRTVLTNDEVLQAVELYNTTRLTVPAIAAHFGMSPRYFEDILYGRSRRHVVGVIKRRNRRFRQEAPTP